VGTLLQPERQKQILALLERKPAWRVGQLATALHTSEATVRRDLAALESKGLVRRVYGGVMLEHEEVPADIRRTEHAAAKEEIAAAAAALLEEGQTVYLDASSTASYLLPHLARFHGLTVITNSHRAVEQLADSKLCVLSTGGTLVRRNMAYVGRVAEATLERFCPDLAFFSAQSVSEDGEITDDSEEETALRRVAMRRARKRVFLCDASKVGKHAFYVLGKLCEMDEIITDAAFPASLLTRAEQEKQTDRKDG